MKCPKCGKEMREGYLAASHPLIFTPKKMKFFLFEGKGDLQLTHHFETVHPEAHICEDCRCVVVEYTELS